MFKVIWDKKAYEELNKLEPIISKRITKKIRAIGENPFNKDIKRLKGSTSFRIRIGDYRVILEIDKEKIIILKVSHRKNIYKK